MTRNPDPYDYQRHVRGAIHAGENLVLQAPTGSGKTRASLEPAIIALKTRPWDTVPQRIIYSVPMRILANGFITQYTERALDRSWEISWHPRIQTGEHPDDPLFEGQLIFATVDQVLASFLNIPYGLPGKLDNINAGAMIGSYLIFDEFHLYPRDQMMLTVLAMLTMLKDVSRFMLMSATFSPVFLEKIAQFLGAEAICDKPGTPLEDGLFHDVKSLNKKRIFFAHDQLGDERLDVEAVKVHRGRRTLVICNTVDRAQTLYRALASAFEGTEVDIRLLHSRFYRNDRTAIEEWVRGRFDRGNAEYDGPPTILLATQVIEVGLDITCNVLMTECAPAASLIQRSGRCARKAGEYGEVHVYQPFDDDGQVNYAPYLDDGKHDVCIKTWNALCSPAFNGQAMNFAQEQLLVERAHHEDDEKLVASLEQRVDERIKEITTCMRTRDSGATSALIREQNSVQVFIHSDVNDETLTTTPWRYEGFGLSRGRIAHAFEEIAHQTDAPFIFAGGKEDVQSDLETPFTRTTYKWHRLREANEVYSFWRFVAHPDAVQYDDKIGLRLVSQFGETAVLSPMADERSWERYAYQSERYHEHINGLYHAYTQPLLGRTPPYIQLRRELVYPLTRLCQLLGKDVEHGEMLMRLLLALHDVGKLNQRWQQWAVAWQQQYAAELGRPKVPIDDCNPLAHTDYDSGNEHHRLLQREVNKRQKRGPHAVESAEACLPILWEASKEDEFWMAICAATIMRHHTPDAEKCDEFIPVPTASDAIERALRVCDFSGDVAARWSTMIRSIEYSSDTAKAFTDRIAPSKNDYRSALMYFLFVRILRLADQRSIVWWQRIQGKS